MTQHPCNRLTLAKGDDFMKRITFLIAALFCCLMLSAAAEWYD
jgi:preprotein translocase subunit SecG